MRCLACDKELNDDEATRRDPENPKEFLDLCDECFYFRDDSEIDWDSIYDSAADETEDIL